MALTEGLEPNEHAALSERNGVPRATLWNRAHGRIPMKEKAKRQQYLNPLEEKVLFKYLLHISKNFDDIY